jgi:geranylgeranyl reductase family protein
MQSPRPVDVLIVGSGPAGASTALHLVQLDPAWAERVVLVDKAVHPREKLCGGGITHLGQHVLAELGLTIGVPTFDLREARLLYKDKSYSFFGNPVFTIVRRDEFDHWLVQQAEARGITVRQGEAVLDVAVEDDRVVVTTEKAVFHAQVVVAADGSRSLIRRKLKWDDDSRVARLLEVLTPEEPRQRFEFQDRVAIFDFTHMTDGLQGYYWDFPSIVKGKAMMNRGVFDSRARPEKPKADLKETLETSMAARDRDLDDYKLKGHPIRWFDKSGRFAIPRVVLTGDAAGADPLVGEGISFALGYGRVTARAVADAFGRQDFSFATYRDQLLTDPLFRHLSLRVRLARLAYLLNYPWLVRLGWQVARWVVRLTRWRDPGFVPTVPPRMTAEG